MLDFYYSLSLDKSPVIIDEHVLELLSWTKKPRRRSHHFIPLMRVISYGNNVDIGADMIIFDLEDSIMPKDKEQARKNISLIPAKPTSVEYMIRVNNFESKYFSKDIEALKANRTIFDCISLTKVETPDVVSYIVDMFPEKSVAVFCETPLGVHNAFDIASVLRKNDMMGLGAGDYAMSMGIERTPIYENDALKQASLHVSSAAHQFNIDFIDTITRYFDSSQADTILEKEAMWAKKNSGAIGKRAIHPTQVGIINRIFSPTLTEIKDAIFKLTKFHDNTTTRGIRATEDLYSGTPQYNSTIGFLVDCIAKGYIVKR